MKKSLLIALLFLSLSHAYKILVVFPIPGKSHSILGDGIVDTLAEAGHEVTIITPFPKVKTQRNVHQVNISTVSMPTGSRLSDIAALSKTKFGLFMMFSISGSLPVMGITHDNVQAMLADVNIQFDVVIAEWFFSPLLAGLASVYECPLIWLCSTDPHHQALQVIDENSSPAYTINLLSDSVPPLDFWNRVYQLWLQIYSEILQRLFYIFKERSSFSAMFGQAFKVRNRPIPSLNDIAYNGSFMFLNAQPAYGVPFKLSQNVKYIGGYHIDPKTKPLPQDLQKIFDDAKDGVIYFSLGSNLKSKDLPAEVKRDLVEMFGRLKQTVLWKFEEDLPNLPKNLHIIKWAPQPSILNHNKTKIFITHGGKLSTTEAVHFGVPIIGIPIFGDQFANMDMAVSKHYALLVTFELDLAKRLDIAIKEILTNPLYTNKAKELSAIYHDVPLTPREELLHWTEHVVRTKGALHLRSPALLVPWYQKLYLDLILLLLGIAFFLHKSYKCLKCNFCNKKHTKKTKSKTN